MHIKNTIIIFSLLLIITGIILISTKKICIVLEEKIKKEDIQNYIEVKNNKYKSVIEIPKINLKEGIGNSLNSGLIYKYDNLIAGHSGNCDYCYFNNLDKLELGDLVIIYVPDKIIYYVSEIYNISKYKVKLDNNLYLITCSKTDKNNRLLIKLTRNT